MFKMDNAAENCKRLEETVETSVKEKLSLLFFPIMNNNRFLRLSFQSVDKDNIQIFKSTVNPF